MACQIIDSSALEAFLFDESGAESVQTIFEKAAKRDSMVLVAASTLAQLRFQISKRTGDAAWIKVKEALTSLPIEFVPCATDLAEIAGEIRGSSGCDLPTSFEIALTKSRKGELITANQALKAAEIGAKVNCIR